MGYLFIYMGIMTIFLIGFFVGYFVRYVFAKDVLKDTKLVVNRIETNGKITPVTWLVNRVNADCHISNFIEPDLVLDALNYEKNYYFENFKQNKDAKKTN